MRCDDVAHTVPADDLPIPSVEVYTLEVYTLGVYSGDLENLRPPILDPGKQTLGSTLWGSTLGIYILRV